MEIDFGHLNTAQLLALGIETTICNDSHGCDNCCFHGCCLEGISCAEWAISHPDEVLKGYVVDKNFSVSGGGGGTVSGDAWLIANGEDFFTYVRNLNKKNAQLKAECVSRAEDAKGIIHDIAGMEREKKELEDLLQKAQQDVATLQETHLIEGSAVDTYREVLRIIFGRDEE